MQGFPLKLSKIQFKGLLPPLSVSSQTGKKYSSTNDAAIRLAEYETYRQAALDGLTVSLEFAKERAAAYSVNDDEYHRINAEIFELNEQLDKWQQVDEQTLANLKTKKHVKWIRSIFKNSSQDFLENQIHEMGRILVNVKSKTKKISGAGIVLYPSPETRRDGIDAHGAIFPSEHSFTDSEIWISTEKEPKIKQEHSTIYKGLLVAYGNKKVHSAPIAAKRLDEVNELGYSYEQVQKRSEREMKVWTHLADQDHPNILPFYGDYRETPSSVDEGEAAKSSQVKPYLISPWASEGNIKNFYASSKENRKKHALKLIGDVILGLEFLHRDSTNDHEATTSHNSLVSANTKDDHLKMALLSEIDSGSPLESQSSRNKSQVWHCDLHPGNILVHIPNGSTKPIAWIADFGLSVDGPEATTHMTRAHYRAPDLVGKEDLRPIEAIPEDERGAYKREREDREKKLEKMDVYSFGMTALYMLTGLDLVTDNVVYQQKELTDRGSLFPEEAGLFDLLKRCCDMDPALRPTMAEVKKICEKENLVPLDEEGNCSALVRKPLPS